MIIIGEKLNSSIPSILKKYLENNSDELINLIKMQSLAGADYLDINTALTSNEKETMKSMIKLCLENSDCGIVLDSPDPQAIIECLPYVGNRDVMINSISLDSKYDQLIEESSKYHSKFICMPMESNTIPDSPEDRFDLALKIVNKLNRFGIKNENIYIDAIVSSCATDSSAPLTTLETVKKIKNSIPHINTVCGLSNVSFGLPLRSKINASFISMMIYAGLDAVIADVLNKDLTCAIRTSLALTNQDEYCIDLIEYSRQQ